MEDDSIGGTWYTTYLKVPALLNCVEPRTNEHDEHLFIIAHQVNELWFKQILFEIDSLREIFSKPSVKEQEMLKVNKRLERIIKIFTILVDQIKVSETMTSLDFAAFQGRLGKSIDFHSDQFRLVEKKMGVKYADDIQHSQAKAKVVSKNETELAFDINESEIEKSLAGLVDAWLQRTPGLEAENFDFWKEFILVCHQWFTEEEREAEKETDVEKREKMMELCRHREKNFEQILVKENYEELLQRGNRSFSWAAFKGALMIYYNRDDVHFHEAFQMLSLLMDIDVLLTKWRSAYALLVQRMIGVKVGSVGSSDCFHLKSSVGDKHRPFLDLFHLSNYLIPQKFVNELQLTFLKTEFSSD